MDIDLLSKIVKELILDNDEVALPGIGSFIAEIVPSVFSDKGYTINPPYRRLSFRQKGSGDENMVIDFYARCNNIDTPTASRIIREFLEEMRRVLETKKSIVFPGLGKLRATKENYFFFVADEDLDIYPEGFGLEPISLKTHEETPAEVSATMAALRSILNPEEEIEEANKPAETAEATNAEEATTAPAEVNAEVAETDQEKNEVNDEEADAKGAENEEETAEANASETETQTTDTAEAAPAEANTEEVDANVNEPAEVNAPAEQTEDNATPSGDNPVNVNDLAANAETAENAGPAENTKSEPAEVPMTDNKSGETMPATTTTSTATTVQATSQKPAGSKTWQVIKWTVIILVILAVTALLTFIILAHIAPDFIDSILYTPEELEILNL